VHADEGILSTSQVTEDERHVFEGKAVFLLSSRA
jgi:hypothetical protein